MAERCIFKIRLKINFSLCFGGSEIRPKMNFYCRTLQMREKTEFKFRFRAEKGRRMNFNFYFENKAKK